MLIQGKYFPEQVFLSNFISKQFDGEISLINHICYRGSMSSLYALSHRLKKIHESQQIPTKLLKMTQSGVGSMQGSNEWTQRGGGTHPQCNTTNGHTYFFWLTHWQTHKAKHWGSMLPKNKINSTEVQTHCLVYCSCCSIIVVSIVD